MQVLTPTLLLSAGRVAYVSLIIYIAVALWPCDIGVRQGGGLTPNTATDIGY